MGKYALAVLLVAVAAVQTAAGPGECRLGDPAGCGHSTECGKCCCDGPQAPCKTGIGCTCVPGASALAPAVFAIATPERVMDFVASDLAEVPAEAGSVLFRPPIA